MALRPLAVVFSGCCILLVTQASLAAVVTWAFEGQVTQINDPGGQVPNVQLGDPMYYEYTFDTNAEKLNVGLESGYYRGISSQMHVGSTQTGFEEAPQIEVGGAMGSFRVWSAGPDTFGWAAYSNLTDRDFVPFDGVTLPTVPYPLAPFEQAYLSFIYHGPRIPPSNYPLETRIYGSITSFDVVPEPNTFLFAALALPALGRKRPRFF